MQVNKITPVLYVEKIESCVAFWVERLGFTTTVEVPDGDSLAFVILHKDGTEIMYQNFANAGKDAPEIAKDINGGRTFLYIEVEKLDPVLEAMKGTKLVLPVRTTFYGAKEFGIKDPAGHMIVFAEMAGGQPA